MKNSVSDDVYSKIDISIINILKEHGITKLYPPQEKALIPTLNRQNVIVSIPTASGKTLIAEITMIQRLLEFRKKGIRRKALYLAPLKALAAEKYFDFREKWSKLGFKIGYSIGDLDNLNSRVFNNDIIIMTNEKADSLLRNSHKSINDIGILVIDEIHLMNDESRGITLEILLARIKSINKSVQIIGLSATISNADEIANWLDGVLIKSEWRPVVLKEGFYNDGKIIYSENEYRELKYRKDDPVYCLVMDVLDDGGQALVFMNTRKNSQTQGEKLAIQLKNRYSDEEISNYEILSLAFSNLTVSTDTTEEAKKLTKILKMGVAFHHAGLIQSQRKFIEDNFRAGNIKVITATPTLAAGVNTPSRRVIIKSLFRYDAKQGGMQKIPVMEYKQMVGRAGRPGYDPYGDSVLLSSNPKRTEELAAYYIYGDPECIQSKLNNIDLLQTHLLGTIVMNKGTNKDNLIDFLEQTFFSYQMKHGTIDIDESNNNQNGQKDYKYMLKKIKEKNKKIAAKKNRKGGKGADPLNLPSFENSFVSAADLNETNEEEKRNKSKEKFDSEIVLNDSMLRENLGKIVEETLDFLTAYEFIDITSVEDSYESTGKFQHNIEIYKPTLFGNIVSKLYINPVTAEALLRRLKNVASCIDDKSLGFKANDITFLYMVSLSGEIYGMNFKSSDYDRIYGDLKKYRQNIEMFTLNYDQEEEVDLFKNMTALKQAFIMNEWINERPISNITESWGIGSGDVQRSIDITQWLSRGIIQFAQLLKHEELIKYTENLTIRLKYGIKKPLIPFVKLRGIGRVRGRILYKKFLSINSLKNATDKEIEKLPLFSTKMANNISKQLAKSKNITYKQEDEQNDSIELMKNLTVLKITKKTTKESTKKKKKPNENISKTNKSKGKTKQTTLF